MTEYIILLQDPEDPTSWGQYGKAAATSPARAIRSLDPREGTYAAVPSRSFVPLTVKTEQVTKVTIG